MRRHLKYGEVQFSRLSVQVSRRPELARQQLMFQSTDFLGFSFTIIFCFVRLFWLMYSSFALINSGRRFKKKKTTSEEGPVFDVVVFHQAKAKKSCQRSLLEKNLQPTRGESRSRQTRSLSEEWFCSLWSVWRRCSLSASTLPIRVRAAYTSPTTLPCIRSAVSPWRTITDWPKSILCCSVLVRCPSLFYSYIYIYLFHQFKCDTTCSTTTVFLVLFCFFSTGESCEVRVRYMLNHYGYFPATMYFEFLTGSTPFCIIREVEAVAKTPLADILGPISPYKAFRVRERNPASTVEVEGAPPER